MKIFLIIGLLFSSSLSFGASSPEMTETQLNAIQVSLNEQCGDEWCDGGDHTYEFKKVEYFGNAKRLTLTIQLFDLNHRFAGKRKCIIYNFKSYEDVMTGKSINDAMDLEVTNCIDTITANLQAGH